MSPTLKCYIEQLDKPIASITAADIQEWQYHLVNEGRVSWSLLNQMVCALRFYFTNDKNLRIYGQTHSVPVQTKATS